MIFEVEQKHRIDDPAALETALAALGVAVGEPRQHTDVYYNHPVRDFAQTDEALRIRSVGQDNFLTYKGPKVDATTKTRRELELPLTPGQEAARQFGELLEALGFVRVATVCKLRRTFVIEHDERVVTGTIDQVGGLGTFAELEIATDQAGLDEARRIVARLAEKLKLGPGERRSYLEMQLARQADDP